ncbi:MAG: prepilin peptidase [Patescibacteria group bacterium]|jgi:prepilin signal peptidase PulO-like enzyme (type II secretory pathway)
MFETFVFVYGLIIGSFLNVVVYRMKNKKDFLKGRSFCTHCRKTLSAIDLVPLLSYIMLRGKCRYCKKSISKQYPLVELGTGLVFLILYLKFGFSLEFYIYALYSVFLIIIFVYDLLYYLVLDSVSIPAIIIGFIGSLVLGFPLTNILIGGIIGLTFFLLQFVISKGKWIGGGDLRLGLMCGFMVGWPKILPLLVVTYVSGAIISVSLLATKKKKWEDSVPLGIFLTLATLVVLLYGNQIIDWYTI